MADVNFLQFFLRHGLARVWDGLIDMGMSSNQNWKYHACQIYFFAIAELPRRARAATSGASPIPATRAWERGWGAYHLLMEET